MNILLYVLTILMLLSLMSYARFEQFFSQMMIQKAFETSMTKDELEEINDRAAKLYNNPYKNLPSKKSQEAPKQRSYSRLSIHPLIEGVEKDDVAFRKTETLLKNLIYYLYRNQPFFQEAMLERSDLLNQFTAKLIEQMQKQEIKRVEELARLDLGDDLLNSLRYFILDGSVSKQQIKQQEKDIPQEERLLLKDNFLPNQGYLSLLSFLNKRKTGQLNIYLASAQLLMAIYEEDQQLVTEVLQRREDLYKQIRKQKSEERDTQIASQEFKEAFAPELPHYLQDFVEFTVTSTNPRNYN